MANRRFTLICPGANKEGIRWERLVEDQPMVMIEDPRLLLSFIALVEQDGFDEIEQVVFGPAVEEETVDRFSRVLAARRECDVVHFLPEGEVRVTRISRKGERAERDLAESDLEKYLSSRFRDARYREIPKTLPWVSRERTA